MTELLRLRAGIALNALLNQILRQRMLNMRRLHEEVCRQLQIAVILQHAAVEDLRLLRHRELVKALVHIIEGLGNLNCTVTAEVEEDDRITIINRTDRLTVLGNHEARQILIRIAAFLTQRLNRLTSRTKLTTVTHHMDVPALLNHRPVSFVAVHGDDHTSASRSDACVERIIVEALDRVLKLIDILKCTRLRNITAIEQRVDTDFMNAFLLGFTHHRNQMRNVGMNVAIRQKTQEMQLPVVFLGIGNRLLPRIRLINRSGRD